VRWQTCAICKCLPHLFFFIASFLIGASEDLLRVGAVSLALAWSLFKPIPLWIALPGLLDPASWGLFLAGSGARSRMIGRADLLGIAGVAAVFSWPGVVMALLGVEGWRRLYIRHSGMPSP